MRGRNVRVKGATIEAFGREERGDRPRSRRFSSQKARLPRGRQTGLRSSDGARAPPQSRPPGHR